MCAGTIRCWLPSFHAWLNGKSGQPEGCPITQYFFNLLP